MSYQLQQAFVHTLINDNWETVTINPTTQTISQLLNLYTGIILQLRRPGINADFYFDLKHNFSIIENLNLRVSEWLLSVNDDSLPVVNTPPYRVYRYVNYRDAGIANYSWRLAARDRHPESGAADGELIDLVLNRSNSDYVSMSKYCMVSVNGIFHYTTPEPYGLRIHDAGSSSFVAGATNIGIHSWAGVGDIQIIPITPQMVSRVDPAVSMLDKARIDIGFPTPGKNALLVLGGYLHILDTVVTQQGQSLIVDIKRLQIAQRVFDAVLRADLQHAVKNFSHDQHWRVATSDLLSEEFVLDYLTISQSFIVIVNTPLLYSSKEAVRCCELAGLYDTKTKPVYPMVTALNRISEYIPRKKGNEWLLYNWMPYYYNFKFLGSNWRQESSVEGSLDSNNPYLYTNGYFWKIYTETISVVP